MIPRLHLVELEDLEWFPKTIRDPATDYLRFIIETADVYAPIVDKLRGALRRSGARRVVDLCSGGAGPWIPLSRELSDELDADPPIVLTDKYPNLDAFAYAEAATEERLDHRETPVDATAVDTDLDGFRTLFSSFHHFPPAVATAILADAVRNSRGIGVFEATHRTWWMLINMLLMPLFVLLCTPLIRPFRWSRLFWTYVIPAVPLLIWFDGTVSCLRSYHPEELLALAAEADPDDSFGWQAERTWRLFPPSPVTWLIGVPRRTNDSTP